MPLDPKQNVLFYSVNDAGNESYSCLDMTRFFIYCNFISLFWRFIGRRFITIGRHGESPDDPEGAGLNLIEHMFVYDAVE